MGFPPIVRARLARLLTASALALLVTAILGLTTGTALAAETPWGSLGSFRLPPCTGEPCEQPAHVKLKPEESAIAVDANDGGFFLAYKPKEFANLKPGEHSTERLVLQRYGAKGEAGANLELNVPVEEGKKEEGLLGTGVEAAFDAADNRLYVLVRWEREEAGANSPAPDGQAAGALYAFSFNGGKLESLASKEGKPAPILGKEGFDAQGESSKEPLLHPLGLTVDPTTKNVLIVGEQDESTTKQIKEEKEVCRTALQWVKIEQSGVELRGKLVRRYVDSTDVLGKHFEEGRSGFEAEECGEEEEPSDWQAYSPVITPGGRVLVMTTEPSEEEGAIWETSAAFNETAGEQSTTPKFLYAYPSATREKELELVTGASSAQEATNPTMSLVSDATTEGKLYVDAFYGAHLPAGVEPNSTAPSALVLHYKEETSETKLSPLGWVGGYHHFVQRTEEPGEIEAAACSLPNGQTGGTVGIPSAVGVVGGYKGGGHEGVVAFKTGFQDMLVGLDLGPGGATKTCLTSAIEGPVVNGGKAVSAGKKVTLASTVIAGALTSVEWTFKYKTLGGATGEEPSEKQLGGGLSETVLEHTFKHSGEYEVLETLNAFGNLAGPAQILEKTIVKVASSVTVALGEAAPVPLGEAAANLEATITIPAGPSGEHVKYLWNFGDGTTAPGETTLNASHQAHVSVGHTFVSRCGGSCSVTLAVEAASGEEGVAATNVTVEENAAERKSHEPPPGGGGGGNESPAPGGSSPGGSAPGGGVKGSTTLGNPEAKLASNSLSVTSAGAFTIKVTCPAGELSCTGTVTIKTASAVKAAKSKKKAILTLASGSFSVAGGQAKTITLHLSAPARTLLAHSHTLAGLATLIAHDSTGASRTVSSHVTLRLVVKHKH